MEPKRITSLSNPAVKAAAKLKQPRASKEAGCFIVEGARSVEELTGDWETESLWVSDTFWGQNHALGWEIAQRLHVPVSTVTVRLSRARGLLKERLKGWYYEQE